MNWHLDLASDFWVKKDSQFFKRSTAQPLLSDIEHKSVEKSKNGLWLIWQRTLRDRS